MLLAVCSIFVSNLSTILSPSPHLSSSPLDGVPITRDIFGYERYRPDQKRGYTALSTTEKRRLDDHSYVPSQTRGMSGEGESPFPSATYSYPRDHPTNPPKPFHHPLGQTDTVAHPPTQRDASQTRSTARPQHFLKQASYNIITGQ